VGLHPSTPPVANETGGVLQRLPEVQGRTRPDRGRAVDVGRPGGPGRQVNARERRLLARIERRLRFEDPELDRQLSRGGRAGATAWLLDFALGLSVLLTSLALLVGAVGLSVVLAAGAVALTVLRLRRCKARRS
jgi:Protein of unknown function (DUF3040)